MKIVKVRVKDLGELKEIGAEKEGLTRWHISKGNDDPVFTERMNFLCGNEFITALNNENEFKFGDWTIAEWMYDVIEEYDVNSKSKISDLESQLQYADGQLDRQSKRIEKLKGYIYELTVKICDEMGGRY